MDVGEFEFVDFYCDICEKNPIKNVKYHCLECENYDLCAECYEKRRLEHWHDHFRKDGRLKHRERREQKEKMIKKAMESSMNRSLSPSRRSIRLLK